MSKLRSVQGLRAVAACSVVFHHTFGRAHGFNLGAAGVDLFFVISGFIMATVAAGQTPGRFVGDRLWRIFPLWLIAVIPWLLLQPHDTATVLASLTLWPVWHGAFTMPALSVGWTLSFELLFYAAFAIALWTRPVVPVTAFVAAMLLSRFTGIAVFDFIGSPMVFEFLLGVVIAQLPPRRFAIGFIALGVLAIAIAPLNHQNIVTGPAASLRLLLWGIPAAMIVYGAVSADGTFAAPIFEPAVFLGDASYSIYLFHLAVIDWFSWPVSLAAAIGCGCLVHVTIERPIARLRQPLINCLRRAAAPPLPNKARRPIERGR